MSVLHLSSGCDLAVRIEGSSTVVELWADGHGIRAVLSPDEALRAAALLVHGEVPGVVRSKPASAQPRISPNRERQIDAVRAWMALHEQTSLPSTRQIEKICGVSHGIACVVKKLMSPDSGK
jgi:hypothetical protein